MPRKPAQFNSVRTRKRIAELIDKRTPEWKKFVALRTRLYRQGAGLNRAHLEAALTLLPGHQEIQELHSKWMAEGAPEKQFYKAGCSYEPLANLVNSNKDFGGGAPAASIRTRDGLSLGSSQGAFLHREAPTAEPVAPKVVDYDKRCSEHQAIRWVAANFSRPLNEIHIADAPSPTAYNLLIYARGGTANEKEFWSNIWSKTIPTKQQIDGDMKRQADNEKLEETLDQILSVLEEEGEPPLQPVEIPNG